VRTLAGGKQLVAYIKPEHTATEIASFRQTLETNLPNYMVPAFIISLSSFPLTAQGKTDIAKLPVSTEVNEDSSESTSSTWKANCQRRKENQLVHNQNLLRNLLETLL
jgi:hypothetical protein